MQYSLIDRRPYSSGLVQYCVKQGIAILAYGVLAGGFLTDEWLHKPLPSLEVCLSAIASDNPTYPHFSPFVIAVLSSTG